MSRGNGRDFGHMRPETRLAIEKLSSGKPGDRISRVEMATHIGIPCDVQSVGYRCVNSAIRNVERVHAIVWRWSRHDQAWICQDGIGCLHVMKRGMRRAGKIARRQVIVSTAVDESGFTDGERQEFRLMQLRCGLTEMSTSGEIARHLKSVDPVVPLKLPTTADLLKAMKPK